MIEGSAVDGDLGSSGTKCIECILGGLIVSAVDGHDGSLCDGYGGLEPGGMSIAQSELVHITVVNNHPVWCELCIYSGTSEGVDLQATEFGGCTSGDTVL